MDCGTLFDSHQLPMRIGIDLTAIWRPATGMENVAIEMTRALLHSDTTNEYVLFFANEVHAAFRDLSARFEPVLIPRVHELFLKNIFLTAAAKQAKLDYFHFPVFPPPWKLPCAIGWTLPDATPWLFPRTMRFKSRWYYRLFGSRAAKTNCVFVTDSESCRSDISAELGIERGRIHVIYHGVGTLFCVSNNPAAFARVRACYSLHDQFVLFVGTLEPRKNLVRLISAFRVLKEQYGFGPDLVIVGRKGWLTRPIVKVLGEPALAGHVHVTGYIPNEDLVTLYNMARMLVFPSLYEGFGLPCAEAMACGCPVVTSNRGALLEVTTGCAAHVDPEDVSSIVRAIVTTNDNEHFRRQLIGSGLRRVQSLSWHSYAERLLDLIESMVRGEPLVQASEITRASDND